MLYSQLHTSIRFAFFGVVTFSGMSVLAIASSPVYADTVNNIRQFDYASNRLLTSNQNNNQNSNYYKNNKNLAVAGQSSANTTHKSTRNSNQNTTQYIANYLSTNKSSNLSSRPSSIKAPKKSASNRASPRVNNHSMAKKATTKKVVDYLNSQAIDKGTKKATNNKQVLNNNAFINTQVIRTVQTETANQQFNQPVDTGDSNGNINSNIKALYQQLQNKTSTHNNIANSQANIQANIEEWESNIRHIIQDNQSMVDGTTVKKFTDSKNNPNKKILNRYSASLTGVLKEPLEPVIPVMPIYDGNHSINYHKDRQAGSGRNASQQDGINQLQEHIRKKVIKQQEELKKFYQQPTNKRSNRQSKQHSKQKSKQRNKPRGLSQSVIADGPYESYKLSASLQYELEHAELVASQDSSSFRKIALEKQIVQIKNQTTNQTTNSADSLPEQTSFPNVYYANSTRDTSPEIEPVNINNSQLDGEGLANKQLANKQQGKQKDAKQRQLVNKLMENAYQLSPKKEVTPTFIKKVRGGTESLTNRLVDKKKPKNKISNDDSSVGKSANNKSMDEGSNKVARCYGQWVYPSSKTGHNNSGKNSSRDNVDIPSSVPNSVPSGWYHALADYGYYDNERYAELTGNVLVRQGNQLIQADKVTLDIKNGTAKAEGGVMFNDGRAENALTDTDNANQLTKPKKSNSLGIVGVADSIEYGEKINAKADGVAFASIPMQAHGYASRMTQNSDSEYSLQDVMFTTCDPVNRKWHLESKSIDLNKKTGRGETRNTTLHIKDVPVLYLPYFNFPIDSRRTSGFLVPNGSINSKTGVELAIPYYFNLAPNYDATVNTRIFANRNPMVEGELRYLTKDFGGGRVVGSYLAKDRKYNDQNRNSLYFQHDWQSKKTPNLTAQLQYNYVSDADYDDDFDYLGVVDNYLNLPRSAKVNYYNDYLKTQLKLEDYQSLEAKDLYGKRIADKDRPYARLPQFTVDYQVPNRLLKPLSNSNVEITGEHDSAYFKNSVEDGSAVEQSGFRMYNKLSASYPYVRSWGYIKPKLSLQHLYASYDEDARIANNVSEQNNSQSVFVPQVSIDAVANFEKKGAPFQWMGDDNSNGYQLLSPRLKYSYAPYQSQNNIPNFNTRIASINYEQLYADSWFLGHDRLQDLHALTPGVNYRYIDEMGVTRLDANIAQQFYLDSGQVTLDGSDGVARKSLFNEDSSGLVANVSTHLYPNLWFDVDGALKDNFNLNYITSQLRYQPTTDSQFSLGVTERKQDNNTSQMPLSAVTASAVFPINNNWRMISQTQYDYDDNQFLDSLVGVDYEDCCIGFSVYGRRYYNDLNTNDDPNRAIMAEVRLKGLSGTSSLNKLLSEKVMGIDKVNRSWKNSPDYH